MIAVFIVTGACMAAGFLLLGLPGALLISVASPFLRLLYGKDWKEVCSGDRAWPYAILLSLGWPLGIPPAFWFLRGKPWLATGAVVVWTLALTVVSYGLLKLSATRRP